MSVGPRIVFVHFADSSSPKLVPWNTHASRVLGTAAVTIAGSSDGSMVWQLVSANNRQLARSVTVHDSFESATTSAREIVEGSADLMVHQVSEAGRGVYGWYASLDSIPVMTCARWYLTERDRRNSIDLAVRSVGAATLHLGSRASDPTLMASNRVVSY